MSEREEGDRAQPQVWTVTERALCDVRATQQDGWPGVRGVTVIGTLWGGDALALSAGVVRWLSRSLAAAPPTPVEVRDRADTFSRAHLAQSQLAASLAAKLENLERAFVARRVDIIELRRALYAVLAEVACGQARIMPNSASPACENAQDALARYGVPSGAAPAGGPRA